MPNIISSGGSSAAPNIRLGVEQSTATGLNERGFLLGAGVVNTAQPRIQLDVANPLRLYKVTHVEVIISDVAPVATLMQGGIIGTDADVPTIPMQKFYGVSIPELPIQNTAMKMAVVSNDVIAGDTFLTPYWSANGNLNTRQRNAGASQNTILTHALNDPWEKIDNLAWNAQVWSGFMTIYFRRIVG